MNMRPTLLLLAILIFTSCIKNDNKQIPNIPENIIIDMNNDGIDDFEINYFYAYVYSPTSTKAIYCKFKIIGENEVLSKDAERYLFLNNLEVINENMDNPFQWNGIDGYIATYKNNVKNEWPSKWEVASDKISDRYFIGIKLNNTSSIKIGWIELEINNKSGVVKIIKTVIL